MKLLNHSVAMLALLFFGQTVKAQEVREVYIASDKTTSIIFPYAIRSVDKGTRDILAQKVKNADTVLQLKAAKPGFTQTNMTVITADGVLYTFLVNYNANPSPLPIYIPRASAATKSVAYEAVQTTELNVADLEAQAREVELQPPFQRVQVSGQQMKLALKATYISEQVLWLTLRLSNKSHVAFRPAYVRFFLTDHKRSKRTAVQETELTPFFFESPTSIRSGRPISFATGFIPFTVPRTKRLIIQVGEQAGGRSLILRIHPRTLLKARLLANSSHQPTNQGPTPNQ